MAVPETNIRYTRIETEVDEAIQAHPDIHDELIRYSWSRDSSVSGDYYGGLSHHSLCKTAITYKGFLGVGAGGFPIYGGYSIRNFMGYDWENDGVALGILITDSSIDPDISIDEYDLELSYDSAEHSTFFVGATGRSQLGSDVRGGTYINTIFEQASNQTYTHAVNFQIANFVVNASIGNNNSSSSGNINVTIDNGYHIDSVAARWSLKNYRTVSQELNGYEANAYARVYRNGVNFGSYQYATNKKVTVGTDGGTNRTSTASPFRTVTPALFGGTSLTNHDWSDQNSFISELSCRAVSPPSPQIERASELTLNSGGYYGFTLRFYHSAATRDYTDLHIRAKYRNTYNSGRKRMYAYAQS